VEVRDWVRCGAVRYLIEECLIEVSHASLLDTGACLAARPVPC
jgi:hypothetical protein